jgi:hypothetical protein
MVLGNCAGSAVHQNPAVFGSFHSIRACSPALISNEVISLSPTLFTVAGVFKMCLYMIFRSNRTPRTKFSTSEQFKNSKSTVDGFQWSIGVTDDMRCSGSQSGLSRVKGVRFLYRWGLVRLLYWYFTWSQEYAVRIKTFFDGGVFETAAECA